VRCSVCCSACYPNLDWLVTGFIHPESKYRKAPVDLEICSDSVGIYLARCPAYIHPYTQTDAHTHIQRVVPVDFDCTRLHI